jgi:hypothetical protein
MGSGNCPAGVEVESVMEGRDVSADMSRRIRKLKKIEEIRRQMMKFGDVCDNGGSTGETYDSRGMTNLWTEDGTIRNGAGFWNGRDEIFSLLDDLAQTLSTHFAANYTISVESDGETAIGHWYVWEAPILTGKALLGCFTHDHVYSKATGEWLWPSWHQTEHFFSPFDTGWVDGPLVMEQRRSFGA